MEDSEWKPRVVAELQRAIAARNEGNEGMARVCARRAAGLIGGEYLRRINHPVRTPSAINILKTLRAEDLSPKILAQIDHFLIHVTPERRLPLDVDLIAEVRCLAIELLGEDPFDFPLHS